MTEKEFREQVAGVQGSREAVNRLCVLRINSFWEERGQTVNARIEQRSVFDGGGRVHMDVVVSDTKNGLPA